MNSGANNKEMIGVRTAFMAWLLIALGALILLPALALQILRPEKFVIWALMGPIINLLGVGILCAFSFERDFNRLMTPIRVISIFAANLSISLFLHSLFDMKMAGGWYISSILWFAFTPMGALVSKWS